jgi:hypothetical protein
LVLAVQESAQTPLLLTEIMVVILFLTPLLQSVAVVVVGQLVAVHQFQMVCQVEVVVVAVMLAVLLVRQQPTKVSLAVRDKIILRAVVAVLVL